jgi:hypothetical protein
LIIKDLYNSKVYLRWEEASEIGIDCGVGIPYTTGNDQTWVMTFLSAQATPIAKRFWVPDQARTALIFNSGDCSKNTDLASLYASKTIGKAKAASAAPGRPACPPSMSIYQGFQSRLNTGLARFQLRRLPLIQRYRSSLMGGAHKWRIGRAGFSIRSTAGAG